MNRICFVFSVLFCFAAQAASFDISTGSLLISESGSWEITGSTHTNSVVVEASGNVNITLKDVAITNVPAAFSIYEGRVNMTLVGSNTLISTEAAGIYVDKKASLTINGDSAACLFATSKGGEGAGIGGNKRYFFRMFSFTSSGFSRINLISSISFSFCIEWLFSFVLHLAQGGNQCFPVVRIVVKQFDFPAVVFFRKRNPPAKDGGKLFGKSCGVIHFIRRRRNNRFPIRLFLQSGFCSERVPA